MFWAVTTQNRAFHVACSSGLHNMASIKLPPIVWSLCWAILIVAIGWWIGGICASLYGMPPSTCDLPNVALRAPPPPHVRDPANLPFITQRRVPNLCTKNISRHQHNFSQFGWQT